MATTGARYEGLPEVPRDKRFLRHLGELLRSYSLLGGIGPRELETLADFAVVVEAGKDHALFVEGEKSGFMCLVVDGNLRVTKENRQGNNRTIADIKPGRSVGEMSLLDGQPHSATVLATEPTVIAVFSKEGIRSLCQSDPRLGAKFIAVISEILSQRLRRTNDVLVQYLD